MEGEINVLTRAQAKKGKRAPSVEIRGDQYQSDINSHQLYGCVTGQNLESNQPVCGTSTGSQQHESRELWADGQVDTPEPEDRGQYVPRQSWSLTTDEQNHEGTLSNGQIYAGQDGNHPTTQTRGEVSALVEEMKVMKRQQHEDRRESKEMQGKLVNMIEAIMTRLNQSSTRPDHSKEAEFSSTREGVRYERSDMQNNQRRRIYQQTSHRQRNRDESSDSEGSNDTATPPSQGTGVYEARSSLRDYNPKLPPFNGKESWEIWFNRFTDVANRLGWTAEERLDRLLPRLQGVAGEFVYGQLSPRIRSNYKALCKELDSRFRIIETSRSYGAKFSKRNQKLGETVESYAAELKRYYDKAYPHRNTRTRREDLLRRFLDGLEDEQARFHIEFIKEPEDINEAVYEAVNFTETRRGMRRGNRSRNDESEYSTRAVYGGDHFCCQSSSEESEGETDELTHHQIARAQPGKNKHKIIKKAEISKLKSSPVDEISQMTADDKPLKESVGRSKRHSSGGSKGYCSG